MFPGYERNFNEMGLMIATSLAAKAETTPARDAIIADAQVFADFLKSGEPQVEGEAKSVN